MINLLFNTAAGPVIAPASSSIYQGKGLYFGSQGDYDVVASVDNANNDGFMIHRKWFLEGEQVTVSGSALSAILPVSIINATGAGSCTASLSDAATSGQTKIIIGVTTPGQVGGTAVQYNGLTQAAKIRPFVSESSIMLYSISNGSGGFKWIPVGDPITSVS